MLQIKEVAKKAVENRAKSFAESYARAFPDVDVASLEAHLSLAGAASALFRHLDERFRGLNFDLTRPSYTIVRALYLAEEHTLAQSKIGEILEVSGPYVTQLIDGLEQDGWVKRIVQRPDRRVTFVRLTPSGRRKCAKLVPAVMRNMVDSVSCLTPSERELFIDLCHKVWIYLETPASSELGAK